MDPSEEELQILTDRRFLEVKESISGKVISYLSEIERSLNEYIKTNPFTYPGAAFINAGKISRGENYNGLPYFILDYPRLFSQKEVFAFRTMLWWGHEFS